jgi:hypothetical protein
MKKIIEENAIALVALDAIPETELDSDFLMKLICDDNDFVFLILYDKKPITELNQLLAFIILCNSCNIL